MIQMYALLVSMVPIYHHPNVYYVAHNALNVLLVQLIVCNVLLEDILIMEIRPVQIVWEIVEYVAAQLSVPHVVKVLF